MLSKLNHYALMLLGLLVNTATLIVEHYVPLSDFVFGISLGVGIGLMILSIFRWRKLA